MELDEKSQAELSKTIQKFRKNIRKHCVFLLIFSIMLSLITIIQLVINFAAGSYGCIVVNTLALVVQATANINVIKTWSEHR